MTQELLYIDGQLVDIPTKGLGITLNFESNILDGLSKRKKNFTNTVKLPKTQRNAEVFGCSDMISVVNTIPYDKHTARYLLNGVEVFNDGECYLLKVGNEYEVSITWGRDPIRRIIEDGALLSDLTGTEMWEVHDPTDGSFIEHPTDTLPDIANIWHNSLHDVQLLKPYSAYSQYPYNPSISVSKILNKIAATYGFTLVTTAQVDSVIQDMYCLISGKKGDDSTFAGEYIGVTFSLPTPPINSVFPLNGNVSWPEVFAVQEGDVRMLLPLGKWKIKVQGVAWFGADYALTQEQMQQVEAYLCDENGNPIAQLTETHIEDQGNKEYSVSIDSDVEVEAERPFCFMVALPSGISIRQISSFPGGSNFSCTITIPYAPEVVPFSTQNKTRRALVYQNLPDVRIADFLATLNAMCNTYIYCVKDDNNQWTVHFAPVQQDTSVDWTSRLRLKSKELWAEVSYSPSGWARHNYIEWNNGYKGDIPVDNDHVSTDERTWVKSVFNIPEGTGYTIPYYKQNEEGKMEYTKPSGWLFYVERFSRNPSADPRMLLATREHLDFDYIVSQRYATFAAWMEHPKVITVQVQLNETDLAELQSIGRIYLAQFGAYFAPISIQYKSGTLSKCQLLKIS